MTSKAQNNKNRKESIVYDERLCIKRDLRLNKIYETVTNFQKIAEEREEQNVRKC